MKVSCPNPAPDGAAASPPFLVSLMRIVPCATFHADAAGLVVHVSARWTEISTLSHEDSGGHGWLHAIHPHDRARVSDGWQHAVKTADDYCTECRLQRSGGELRYVRLRTAAVLGPRGERLGFVGVVEDLTEATQAGTRHYLQRLETLAAIDHAILDARSSQAIGDAVVSKIAVLFPANRVSIVLFSPKRDLARSLSVWSARPTTLPTEAASGIRADMFPPEVLEGRPFVVDDLLDVEPRTGMDEALARDGVRSYICAPMRTPTAIIGSLNICSPKVEGFDQAQLVVAQEIADRLAVAITNARLLEVVQSTQARLNEVREAERRGIARELHDEIGQVLAGLKLRLELARAQATPAAVPVLDEATGLLTELVTDVRWFSLNLRPPLLDDFGLYRALLAHFDRFTAQTGVTVEFESAGIEEKRFAPHVETAAFRIVQEALTNVARHAGVSNACVEVRCEGHQMRVTVADRGRGLPEDAATATSAGISGMRERAVLLGGTIDVQSSPRQGTIVIGVIPIDAAKDLEL